jgi:hypothetical protein
MKNTTKAKPKQFRINGSFKFNYNSGSHELERDNQDFNFFGARVLWFDEHMIRLGRSMNDSILLSRELVDPA